MNDFAPSYIVEFPTGANLRLIAFVTNVTSDLAVIAALLPDVPFDVIALINTEFEVCIS
jgi:hypothetical protein